MSILNKPLHTGLIGGRLVRFFRTPLKDGRPDFVWHCVDDLHAALGMPGQLRKVWMRKFKHDKWPSATIAVTDTLLTVAPHFVAQGTVDAMIDLGKVGPHLRNDYDRAAADAGIKNLDPLNLHGEALLEWLKVAYNRWD